MKASTLAALVCLVVISHALPTERRATLAGRYKRLIVFGDSLSDDGSGAWSVSNHTWPTDPAYYNHSFSNGPAWPTILSRTLSTLLIDYAVGGATTNNAFVRGYTVPNSTTIVPSAYDQLAYFLATDTPRKHDLFVHYSGANDALFNPTFTGAQTSSLINADVQALYSAGAKHILLANYPPVSTVPATYGNPTYASTAPAFAASLKQGLANIGAAWAAYIHIGIVDVQALYADIVANPAKYGVDKEYVNPPTPCVKGIWGFGESVCKDPERHLFWDGFHPVARVHERIAGLFEKALGG